MPPFGPEDKEQNSQKWCNMVGELRDIFGWSEDATIYFVLSKLRGLAVVWYKGYSTIKFT